jgi:hypothetical protein
MAAPGEAGDYAAALDAFRVAHVGDQGPRDGVVAAYHAVRNMPYFSGQDRTPLAALRSGRGACTAKHLVLRDLLRLMGADAGVEIVKGDFASGIPVHATMPSDLRAEIGRAGVVDYHCRVRLTTAGGRESLLDATWPDSLAAKGFAVASDWAGQGDTIQAIEKVEVIATPEDVLSEKARLLATLPEADAVRRLRFLALLSQWLTTAQDDRPKP